MRKTAFPPLVQGVFVTCLGVVSTAAAQGYLEIPQPGSAQSGVGLISGWHCEAQHISVRIDGGREVLTAYGTERADTVGVCGDSDNGFSLLFNYNGLAPGTHDVIASADGTPFASATFSVSGAGIEYLDGVSASTVVPDFPFPGQSLTLDWQQANQNFVVSGFNPDSTTLDGRYTLVRAVVAVETGDYFDSTSNMHASGELVITGDHLQATIHSGINGLSDTTSFQGSYRDYGAFALFQGGLRIAILQRVPFLITQTLETTQVGVLSETLQWRRLE